MARQAKENKKIFHGTFNGAMWDKVQQIKERLGLSYDVNALEYCILSTYKDTFKDYVEIARNRPQKENISPEERAERYVSEQKAKKEAQAKLEYENGLTICQALDGEVKDHGNGFYGCDFKTYEKVGANVLQGKLLVPFEHLSEFHVNNQFKGGTKAEILKTLKESN